MLRLDRCAHDTNQKDNVYNGLFQDSGAYLEHRLAGVDRVQIKGLNAGTLDLTNNGWGHIVGLVGEQKQIYTDKGMGSVTWKPAVNDRPLTWYKVN